MKTKLFAQTAFFAMLLCFSVQSQAQKIINDTLFYFNQPLQLDAGGRDFIGYSESSFVLKQKSSMKRIPAAYAKKLSLPSNTKMATEPIIIRSFVKKFGDTCFRFSCTPNCDRCHLLWYDRNGDGKIQPSSEIRCVNERGKVLSTRATRVDCE